MGTALQIQASDEAQPAVIEALFDALEEVGPDAPEDAATAAFLKHLARLGGSRADLETVAAEGAVQSWSGYVWPLLAGQDPERVEAVLTGAIPMLALPAAPDVPVEPADVPAAAADVPVERREVREDGAVVYPDHDEAHLEPAHPAFAAPAPKSAASAVMDPATPKGRKPRTPRRPAK